MSRKRQDTSVRLLAAIGALYVETRALPEPSAEITLAKLSALNLLSTLLKSPAMVERLAELMEASGA